MSSYRIKRTLGAPSGARFGVNGPQSGTPGRGRLRPLDRDDRHVVGRRHLALEVAGRRDDGVDDVPRPTRRARPRSRRAAGRRRTARRTPRGRRSRRRCRAGRGRPARASTRALDEVERRERAEQRPGARRASGSAIRRGGRSAAARGRRWPSAEDARSAGRGSPHSAVMNSDDRRSSTRIRFVRSSASAGPRRVVDRGVDQRPGERHEQRRRDALAGHVGDDDASRPAAAAEPEHVEEVAADLARRLVVAGDVVARDVGRRRAATKLRWIRRAERQLLPRADGRRRRRRSVLVRSCRRAPRARSPGSRRPPRRSARRRGRRPARSRPAAGRSGSPCDAATGGAGPGPSPADAIGRPSASSTTIDEPEPGARTARGSARAARGQRVAADDLAGDDLAGSDRLRPRSPSADGLRTPRSRLARSGWTTNRRDRGPSAAGRARRAGCGAAQLDLASASRHRRRRRGPASGARPSPPPGRAARSPCITRTIEWSATSPELAMNVQARTGRAAGAGCRAS